MVDFDQNYGFGHTLLVKISFLISKLLELNQKKFTQPFKRTEEATIRKI